MKVSLLMVLCFMCLLAAIGLMITGNIGEAVISAGATMVLSAAGFIWDS